MSTSHVAIHVPFVDLTAQYHALREQVGRAMESVLVASDFILGEEVARFEEAFAAYCQADHAVGVDSGTSALELILRGYGIGVGDEVITVANTFIASALAIVKTGARPVLVDVDPEHYTLDAAQAAQAITPRTRALMPVHLYGQPAEMEPILELARGHNLRVIEDACQAHGARYQGRRTGALGDAAAFSFYPAKNLGAYGDGGMVVTNDPALAEWVRMYRNYGQRVKYHHEVQGYNHRLDTLQAAVLRVKLGYLDGWNGARRQHAATYAAHLAATPMVSLPSEPAWAEGVYHLYVVRIRPPLQRQALQDYLRAAGIATGIHYPIPLHLQPAFAGLGYGRGDFPVAEQLAEEILSLPMYPELSPEMIAAVAQAIRQFVAESDGDQTWMEQGILLQGSAD